MKITNSCVVVLIGLLAAFDASAQSPQPVAPPVARKRTLIAAEDLEKPKSPELLSANYRVTFSGTSGDKSLGELTVLTCSPSIQVSGPLDSTENAATFNVSGAISEMDGALVFAYTIQFSVHTVSGIGAPGQPARANLNYNSHSTTGTLRLVAGEKYEILKCGGNTYTIVISPEAKK